MAMFFQQACMQAPAVNYQWPRCTNQTSCHRLSTASTSASRDIKRIPYRVKRYHPGLRLRPMSQCIPTIGNQLSPPHQPLLYLRETQSYIPSPQSIPQSIAPNHGDEIAYRAGNRRRRLSPCNWRQRPETLGRRHLSV